MTHNFQLLSDTEWITKILNEKPEKRQDREYPDVKITPKLEKTIRDILAEKLPQ